MPKRVLFMISSMRGGGSERQTLLLLQHVDRTRIEPHLYLTERAGNLLSQIPSDVPVHSFDDHVGRGGLYYPGRIMNQQVSHLRAILAENRIEAVYDRTFHMTLVAGPACDRMGIPRVSTMVSPPHQALPMVEQRFVRFKRWRLANAYKKAAVLVAVSRAAAQSAERYYRLHSGSVRVIPNPVEFGKTDETTATVDRSLANPIQLICVGRMTTEKGHADLIRAIAFTESNGPEKSKWPETMPRLSLTMVGDGPLRHELEEMARESIHRQQIDFVGNDPAAIDRMRHSDALVLPSIFEGMPNVVLEAMALGLPVIATRSGGTIELQKDEPTMFFAEPNDPPSLASAILDFATDPAETKKRTAAATRYVREHHDVAKTTRAIEDLLVEACVTRE
ncbi:glycosyltransferase [Novipirellula artificiosorum]|nr:glycosyltransferase [Novipirellula artificiosorum]